MKGMLTGPVTMLQWSFVRDDMPRETVCRQIALAIRDEVADLEAAGIAVIQVDEPAFREGLPLRHADWAELSRAGRSRASGWRPVRLRDDTSIHTHMCYSRVQRHHARHRGHGCRCDLHRDDAQPDGTAGRLRGPAQEGSTAYPAEIGPGIWDIHSPRVPDVDGDGRAARVWPGSGWRIGKSGSIRTAA